MSGRKGICPGLIIGLLTAGSFLAALGAAVAPLARQSSYPPLDLLNNALAWSGTQASASAEWIELYNPPPADALPGSALKGDLKTQAYFLLERSDTASLKGLAASGQLSRGILRRMNRAADPLTETPTPTPTDSLTPTFTDSPTDTPVATATGSPTFTPSPTGTPTPSLTLPPSPTFTPVAPGHIVIASFRTRGLNGTNDEYVELYNPTGIPVNVGGWTIRRAAACPSTTTYTLLTIKANTLLYPGQHFLAATSASGLSADQTFSPGIDDTGGLALANASGALVDQVGLCISAYYVEGTNLQPLDEIPRPNDDVSYDRKPGAGAACYDVGSNAADFAPAAPSDPLNLNSPAVVCAGVLTATPTFTPRPSPTPSRVPLKSPTPALVGTPGALAIDAFLPHPRSDWNGDGTTDVGDEYVEIINVSTTSVSLKGWRLDNGINGSSLPYTFPDVTLLPLQIAAFFHADTGIGLSDGGGTVRLLRPNGSVADAINYPLVTDADRTWCRLPDGTGAWTFVCRPTPNSPNVLAPAAPSGLAGEAIALCSMTDTVPAAILSAECSAPGGGLWNPENGGMVWLPGRWKWDAFFR